MSEFDEEAEREKLREQLEAEQEDREATQRMSELLLGGATMTGKHCERCASPIFRQNGQEFCPNCNQAVGETAQAGTDQEAPGEAAGQPTADQPTTGQSAAERAAEGAGETERTVDPAGASQPQVEPAGSIPQRQPDATGEPAPSTGAGESVPPAGASEVAGGGDGDLAAARDALARKLTRLAAQAEATDDVGHARELLAATREAADALAALERIGDGL
jgi:uncharacterized Zn finger protein (UPF0148 family)